MRCKLSLISAIATSCTMAAIAPPMFANPLRIDLWKISQQDNIPTLPSTASLIYVAPQTNPNGDGSVNNPYSSITAALATKPKAGTVIQLQQGNYNAETGESFPIRIPAGVTLRGEPSVRGINTIINGGGKFISPSFASQNITVLANDDVRLEGITLTNSNTRGTAVWVESSKQVAIANNSFLNSNREGIFLTGTADAIISDNLFKKNGANGLSAVGSSTGEIKNNTFESTGFGLAIGQKSRMNVSNNNILNNVDGIVISNLAAPTLRSNIISDNQRNGIVILKDRKGYPTPDLGTSSNLGKNIFRNNLGKDLNNNSGVTQVAVGNQLDSKKIAGDIAFIGESPTPPVSETASNPINPISNNVEITRSPQPSSNLSSTTPKVIPPSNSSSTLIEPLLNVPQTIFTPKTIPIAPIASLDINPKLDNSAVVVKTSTQNNISQNPNEVLIDREPIPVTPPPNVTKLPSQSIPSNPSSQTIPSNTNPVQVPPTYITPTPLPYNAKIAALVPPAAREKFPYLVVIPASDQISLDRVRSVVPSAKIVPSRFGNVIIVQGYPDRDRAEVLKTIMRSEIGLDARVVHQNNL